MYDVFISFKNSDGEELADRELSLKVYKFLIDKNLKVFLAPITLKALGKDEWEKEIDKAISRSKIFIALGSKKSYFESSWPQKERTSFIALKKHSDETKAIYNYIQKPMNISNLPDDMSCYETFKDEKDGELIRLYTYIKNHFATHQLGELPPILDSEFAMEVLDALEEQKLVVLFSQELTNIAQHYHDIKQRCRVKFDKAFHIVSVPSYTDDQKRYFNKIAQDCCVDGEIKELQDWKEAMHIRLKNNNDKVLLLVNDLEDGNLEFDKQFATTIRALNSKFPNFFVIFVGRKALASLVYGEGDLSPLNTAKTLFFPTSNSTLDEDMVALQFDKLFKNREDICTLLEKENLGRYRIWSANTIINELFWKNLLLKNGTKFVWRDEVTKEIAKDVLECEK